MVVIRAGVEIYQESGGEINPPCANRLFGTWRGLKSRSPVEYFGICSFPEI